MFCHIGCRTDPVQSGARQVEGTPASAPAPRANHSMAWLGARLLLLGGVGASGELGGVHLLENPAAVKVMYAAAAKGHRQANDQDPR